MERDLRQPTETELKLALTADGLRRLKVHEALRLPDGGKQQQRRLVATYFDTAEKGLFEQGLTLRVRREDGSFIQTLKSTGARGVAASRGEWEWEIKGNAPNVSLLADTPVAERLPDRLAARLKPILVTDINRISWNLQLDDGTEVEAALDEGNVEAAGREEPVRELELELHCGTRGSLYRIALELHAVTPLTIAVESKAERGYRLLGAALPVGKAPDVRLSPDVTAAEAFRQIIESALGHLLINRSAATAGDKEGIHQMRVAIRRLRAACVLFKPLLDPHALTRFDDELRRIGRVFGEARDWDVFCTEMLPSGGDTSGTPDWPGLLSRPADLRRAAAHAEFAKECDAPAFTGLILGLAGWVEDGSAAPEFLGTKKAGQPIASLASDLLDVLADKVDRRGRHIGRRPEPELHALRKSLKKLRYGIEFLEALFPRKERKHYVRQCKRLQKILGSINDAVMAVRCAESLAQGEGVQLAPSMVPLFQQTERRKQACLSDLGHAWQAFHKTPRFWR